VCPYDTDIMLCLLRSLAVLASIFPSEPCCAGCGERSLLCNLDGAIPERFPIHQQNSREVAGDDPDFLEALRILGLILGE
jgi:hypothetical protein